MHCHISKWMTNLNPLSVHGCLPTTTSNGPCFLDPLNPIVYQKNDMQWSSIIPITSAQDCTRSQCQPFYILPSTPSPTPPEITMLHCCTSTIDNTIGRGIFQVTSAPSVHYPHQPRPLLIIGNTKLQNSLWYEDHFLQHLVSPLECTTNGIQQLLDHISTDNLHCCTDGSVKHGQGCHSCFFFNSEGNILLRGAVPDDSDKLLLTSTAEHAQSTATINELYEMSSKQHWMQEFTHYWKWTMTYFASVASYLMV